MKSRGPPSLVSNVNVLLLGILAVQILGVAFLTLTLSSASSSGNTVLHRNVLEDKSRQWRRKRTPQLSTITTTTAEKALASASLHQYHARRRPGHHKQPQQPPPPQQQQQPIAPADSLLERVSSSLVSPSSAQKTPPAQNPLSDLYVWVHIPKTSGSRGYQMFVRSLDSPLRNATIFPPTAASDWNSPGCMGNLVSYGASHCSRSELHDCLLHQPDLPLRPRIQQNDDTTGPTTRLHYSTILRDPVDRILSEYFWWKKRPHAAAWTAGMQHARNNLTEWILCQDNVAHNRQAMYMLLNNTHYPTDYDECIHMMGTKLYERIVHDFGSVAQLNDLWESSGNATISSPDELLDSFDFVAVMEEIEVSKEAFRILYNGVEPARAGSKLHASRGKDAAGISEETRELIRQHNRLDVQLHKMARQRLKNIIATSEQPPAEME